MSWVVLYRFIRERQAKPIAYRNGCNGPLSCVQDCGDISIIRGKKSEATGRLPHSGHAQFSFSVFCTEATMREGSGKWPRSASIAWPSLKTNFRKPRSACPRDEDMASALTNIQLNPVMGYTFSPGMLVSDERRSPLGLFGHAAAALSGVASTNIPLAFCTRPMLAVPFLAVLSSA